MIKKMAILRVTPEALRELLQLPDETEVVRVELAPGARGTLHIMIEGAGWDTGEGMPVQPAPAAVVTKELGADGNLLSAVIDWGLPE